MCQQDNDFALQYINVSSSKTNTVVTSERKNSTPAINGDALQKSLAPRSKGRMYARQLKS